MNDEIDEAYERGVRDTRITALETRVNRIEKVGLGVIGAIATAWAKLAGFWQ